MPEVAITLLERLPVGQIRGTVRGAGAAPVRAEVHVEPLGAVLNVAEDGTFVLDVVPGRYQVTIVADARTYRVLGAHLVGPRASDLVAELVLAIELGASAEDLARTMHAHPSLPEAVRDAALAVAKRPIHI